MLRPGLRYWIVPAGPDGWLAGALLGWLPVAVAILVASTVRFVVLLATWDRSLAMLFSLLPSGAIVLWASWVLFRRIGSDYAAVRGRVALVWGVASVALRAVWVGPLLGGGWDLIRADYASRNWEPWPVLLGLIVVSPFLFRSAARTSRGA